MYKKLLYGIAVALALFNNSVQAQVQDSSYRFPCRLSVDFIEAMTIDSPGHGASFALTLPASFPAAAIDTCGKFQVFYADLELAPATGIYKGFADATLGATRRNTMCAALHYIQSRIDFGTLADTEYIRLYVDTSCSSAFPAGAHYLSSGATMHSFLALSSPYHAPMAAGDTVNGFIHDFITTGIDPNIGDYHGYIKMNFDSAYLPGLPQPIIYNNDLSDPFCTEFDLCYVLIHYITHTLGWFSWTDNFHSGTSSSSNYTNYDLSLHKTPWRRFAVNPFGSLTKVFPSSPAFAADYWVNDHLPPDNYPVNPGTPSHLSESYYDLRVSPGEYQQYVMGATFGRGQKKREFMKGEWETLHNTIGYTYNTDFYSDSNSIIVNHPPHSVKMGADTMNRLFYFGFIQSMQEYIPADYHIRNDVGTSVIINLNSLADLQDADGDSISIYPGSLVNFRGCGTGGNNHNLLSVTNSGKTISYTPRANFYGRAQFGFTLSDGIEKGGFVIFTIDVSKGNNVSLVSGGNLLLNGDFEEGSEIRTDDTNLHIPNGVFSRDELSQHMSDSHPYDYSNGHFGTAIRNAHKVCTLSPDKIFYFGHDWCTFPDTFDFFGSYYIPPNPFLGVGNRYQPIAISGVNFYLADTLLPCQRYVLEFDALRTLTSASSVYPYPKFDSIIIGFGRDTFFNPTGRTFYTAATKPYPTDSIKFGIWNHLSIPFTYCKDSSANIISLFIKGLNGFAPAQVVDNVSLRAVTEPLSFNLHDSAIGNCSRRLYSDLYDLGCSSFSYEWRKLGDTAIIATTSTMDVSNTVEKSYTLKISDGCSFNVDTITVAPCPCMPGAVFGAAHFDTLTTAILPTTVSSGYYYIPTDLTITNTTVMTGAKILIERGVTITVADSVKLTLDSCHLFTCDEDTAKGMWRGIILASGTTSSGRIEVRNNCLIEDALFAIDAITLRAPASGDIISVTNSTFNRNQVDISMNDYKVSSPAILPFTIKDNLFTARMFSRTSMSGYPNTWTGTATLKATTSVTDSKAPYYISKTPELSKALCKDTTIASYLCVRTIDIGATSSAGVYQSEVKIGEGTSIDDYNLFDNHRYGVVSYNSNISLYHNYFINISRRMTPSSSTTAPIENGMAVILQADKTTITRAQVIPSAFGNLTNKFHDCFMGIYTENVTTLNISNTNITTSNTAGAAVAGAAYAWESYSGYGMMLHCEGIQKNTNISGNIISNVNVGIQLGIVNPKVGDVSSVSSNFLYSENPDPAYAAYRSGQCMSRGIDVNTSSGVTWIGNTLNINDNYLTKVFNGILLNGLTNVICSTTNNTITIWDTITPVTSSVQHGIRVHNTNDATISANAISNYSNVLSADRIRGVMASSNINVRICGNTTTKIGRGFEFSKGYSQTGTRWIGNTMNDGYKGMVLASDIGDQGFTYNYASPWPRTFYGAILNKWDISGSGKFQTYVDGTTRSSLSKLYVRNITAGMVELPSSNDAFISMNRYINSSTLLTTQLESNCHGAVYMVKHNPIPDPFGPKTLGLLIIADSLGYDSTYNVRQWMSQLSLYELGTIDPDLRDSSYMLDSFMNEAAGSRFAWLTDIESAINSDDFSTAQYLLDNPVGAMGRVIVSGDLIITDYSDADEVVENYTNFYSAYLQFLQGSMTDSDTAKILSIAQKCPVKDGAVVYKARALQQRLSFDYMVYNDDSCEYNNGQYRMVQNPTLTGGENQVSYTLYPNPNNGVFSIRQTIIEDKEVAVRLYNAVGGLIAKESVQFKNGIANFKVQNVSAGLYMICLTEGQNKPTCLKFNIH